MGCSLDSYLVYGVYVEDFGGDLWDEVDNIKGLEICSIGRGDEGAVVHVAKPMYSAYYFEGLGQTIDLNIDPADKQVLLDWIAEHKDEVENPNPEWILCGSYF